MRRNTPITKVEINLLYEGKFTPAKKAQQIQDVKKGLLFIQQYRTALQEEIDKIDLAIKGWHSRKRLGKILVYGFFSKKHKAQLAAERKQLDAQRALFKKEQDEFSLKIDIHLRQELIDAYYEIDSGFRRLISSRFMWLVQNRFFYHSTNITMTWETQKLINASSLNSLNSFWGMPLKYEIVYPQGYYKGTIHKAKSAIVRNEVKIQRKDFPGIDCLYKAFYWINVKGEELYLYPTFMILKDAAGNIVVKDINEVEVKGDTVLFVETHLVAPDACAVETALYTEENYDYQSKQVNTTLKGLIVFEYGKVIISVRNIWSQEFQFSNGQAALAFIQAFDAYKNTYASLV